MSDLDRKRLARLAHELITQANAMLAAATDLLQASGDEVPAEPALDERNLVEIDRQRRQRVGRRHAIPMDEADQALAQAAVEHDGDHDGDDAGDDHFMAGGGGSSDFGSAVMVAYITDGGYW